MNDTLPRKQPEHSCPFSGKIDEGVNQHVEGRFAHLETEVSGLKNGLNNLEQSVSEGFKAVFTRIDSSNNETRQQIQGIASESRTQIQSISESREANRLPWVLIWVTLAGVVIAGITTIFYQALSGVQISLDKGLVNIASGIEETKKNLAVANAHDLEYREAKGRSDAKSEYLERAMEELDDKFQRETVQASAIIDAKINGLDSKIQTEFQGWRKAMDDRTSVLAEVTHEISDRQLKILEQTGEERGKVNTRLDGQAEIIRKLDGDVKK